MGLLALLAALVCFLVVAVLGFGVFTGAHLLGWLGLGLGFLTLGLILGAVAPFAALTRGR